VLLRTKTIHALTGQEIHVSVYGITPEDAAVAVKMESANALAAIALHKDQAFRKARSEAMRQEIERAVNDPASIAAGAKAGREEIKDSPPTNSGAPKVNPTPQTPTGQVKQGAVTGTTDVSDDF